MAQTNYQRIVEDRLGTSIPRFILQCEQDGLTDLEGCAAMSEAARLNISIATYRSWKRRYVVVERSCRLREPVAAG